MSAFLRAAFARICTTAAPLARSVARLPLAQPPAPPQAGAAAGLRSLTCLALQGLQLPASMSQAQPLVAPWAGPAAGLRSLPCLAHQGKICVAHLAHC